jgi:alcohol dehydrogenase class IV
MDRLTRSIGAYSKVFLELPSGEPSIESLESFKNVICREKPDWIVVVGGGSAIDSAKLLWISYELSGLSLDKALIPNSLPPLRSKARLAVIPTTVGSGSEVSSTAVYSDSGSKRFVYSHELIPDLVVLDPQFLAEIPDTVLFETAFDALSHAMESYVSRNSNIFLDVYAEKAAQVILNHLPDLSNGNRDSEVLSEMMVAAMLAGSVQNHKVPGIGHAVAHQLGNRGVGHGLACAMMLPRAMDINMRDPSVRTKYDKMAKQVGLETAADLHDRVSELRSLLKLPTTVASIRNGREVKFDGGLEPLVADLMEDVCFKANPVDLGVEEVTKVLQEVIS